MTEQGSFSLNFDLNDSSFDETETVSAAKRFRSITESEKKRLIDGLTSDNTKKGTERAIRTFIDWVKEAGRPLVNFETITPHELSTLLCDFWFEVRTKTGEHYKANSLQNIRHGINRPLKELKRDFDIISSPDFGESNVNFKAQMRQLKRIGKGDTEHHEPLTEEDLLKAYDYFREGTKCSPSCLQQKVWFDLSLHLLRRGRENLRNLKTEHFKIATDSSGYKYIYQCRDEQTKNHQEDGSKQQGRMYEARDEAMCPVKSFEHYTSLLHPTSILFFQQPNHRAGQDDLYWYYPKPVGHNTLGDMMVTISSKASLGHHYTNHCLRATSVTLLDEAKFPGRNIMTVSGHKSETSLKSYSHHTSEATKRSMSHTLNKNLGLKSIQHPSTGRNTSSSLPLVNITNSLDEPTSVPQVQQQALAGPVPSDVPPVPSDVPSFEEISDQLLAEMPMPLEAAQTSTSNASITSNSCFQWNLPVAPIIKDSVVNIHYNIFNK